MRMCPGATISTSSITLRMSMSLSIHIPPLILPLHIHLISPLQLLPPRLIIRPREPHMPLAHPSLRVSPSHRHLRTALETAHSRRRRAARAAPISRRCWPRTGDSDPDHSRSSPRATSASRMVSRGRGHPAADPSLDIGQGRYWGRWEGSVEVGGRPETERVRGTLKRAWR